jgi:acyl carrier protein
VSSETEQRQVAGIVRELLISSWPARFDAAQLHDEVSLGKEGLGLDSIEIVELLVACEECSGVELTADLFNVVPLTIGHVTAHFRLA